MAARVRPRGAEVSAAARIRELPERGLRRTLLALSHRRALGRLAGRLPVTRPMVARFIVGETLDEALDALARLKGAGFGTTVDLLGEAVTSPEAVRAAGDGYLATLDALAARGLDGNVSLKLTQMGLDIDRDLCRATVARIFARAAMTGSFVRIDMEDHARTDRTLALWREVRSVNPHSGVVIQAALRRSPADVDALIAEGGRVRLCKGAYKEPAAIAFTERAAVDRAFATLAERLLRDGAYPALATHDARLVERAISFAEREGIGPERFEFQMLHGIRRDLQAELLRRGYRVRIYVPYGAEWYPYFMRRLAERPANLAFILPRRMREGGRRRGTGTRGEAGTGPAT